MTPCCPCPSTRSCSSYTATVNIRSASSSSSDLSSAFPLRSCTSSLLPTGWDGSAGKQGIF
eukprot:749359-Hanusia_phi.AAC.8